MTGKTIGTITALALTGTMAFAAGAGQGHGRGEGQGRGERGDRMARMAEELQLSNEQIEAIKQMREATAEERRAHRQQAQALATQWMELKDQGDTKGAEKVQKQLSSMREEAQIRKLAGTGKFQSVLTDAQKQKFEQLKAERPRQGRGHGRGKGPCAAPGQ